MTERLSQEGVDLWASYDTGCRDDPGWSHNLLAREVRDWREIAAVLNEYFAGNCRRDHHGYCQEHLLEEECTVGRMRDLLAEIDAAALREVTVQEVRRAICKVVGHRWVFSHVTLPRQTFCATCGRRA